MKESWGIGELDFGKARSCSLSVKGVSSPGVWKVGDIRSFVGVVGQLGNLGEFAAISVVFVDMDDEIRVSSESKERVGDGVFGCVSGDDGRAIAFNDVVNGSSD